MDPMTITTGKLQKVIDDLIAGIESSIGTYLFKGLRIQISKYKASGSERFARLYHRRRDQGLCVICGTKVTDKNPKTKKTYRLCNFHRDKIDKK
jgi:hypothetical protein